METRELAMSDIFISYAREDRARAKILAGALERQGWSVWWDREIPPGKEFSEVIEEAIGEAKCVIVLWSTTSVKSQWVKNEAAEGAHRQILVPALIDDVEIPFEFRRLHAANLVDWQGSPSHPEFDTLLKAIRAIVGQPSLMKQSESTIAQQEPADAIQTQRKGTPKEERLESDHKKDIRSDRAKTMEQKGEDAGTRGKLVKVFAAILILVVIIIVIVFFDRNNKRSTDSSSNPKQLLAKRGEYLFAQAEKEPPWYGNEKDGINRHSVEEYIKSFVFAENEEPAQEAKQLLKMIEDRKNPNKPTEYFIPGNAFIEKLAAFRSMVREHAKKLLEVVGGNQAIAIAHMSLIYGGLDTLASDSSASTEIQEGAKHHREALNSLADYLPEKYTFTIYKSIPGTENNYTVIDEIKIGEPIPRNDFADVIIYYSNIQEAIEIIGEMLNVEGLTVDGQQPDDLKEKILRQRDSAIKAASDLKAIEQHKSLFDAAEYYFNIIKGKGKAKTIAIAYMSLIYGALQELATNPSVSVEIQERATLHRGALDSLANLLPEKYTFTSYQPIPGTENNYEVIDEIQLDKPISRDNFYDVIFYWSTIKEAIEIHKEMLSVDGLTVEGQQPFGLKEEILRQCDSAIKAASDLKAIEQNPSLIAAAEWYFRVVFGM